MNFFFNYLFQYSSRNKNNDVEETDDDDEEDLTEGSGEFLFGDEDVYEDVEEEEDIKEVKERYVTKIKLKS